MILPLYSETIAPHAQVKRHTYNHTLALTMLRMYNGHNHRSNLARCLRLACALEGKLGHHKSLAGSEAKLARRPRETKQSEQGVLGSPLERR